MKSLKYVTLTHEDYLDEDVNLLPGVIRVGKSGCRITVCNIGFALPTEPGSSNGICRLEVQEIKQGIFGSVQLTLWDPSVKKKHVHVLSRGSVLQQATLVKWLNVMTLTLFVAFVGTVASVICALR